MIQNRGQGNLRVPRCGANQRKTKFHSKRQHFRLGDGDWQVYFELKLSEFIPCFLYRQYTNLFIFRFVIWTLPIHSTTRKHYKRFFDMSSCSKSCMTCQLFFVFFYKSKYTKVGVLPIYRKRSLKARLHGRFLWRFFSFWRMRLSG